MAFVGKVEEDEVEDVEKLKFPSAFKHAKFLTHAEVAIILEDEHKSRVDSEAKTSTVFTQAYELVSVFNGGVDPVSRTAEGVEEIRKSLANLTFSSQEEDGNFATMRLDPWEVVSFANLTPETVEEALAVIPSMARFREDDIQKVLDTLMASTSRLHM